MLGRHRGSYSSLVNVIRSRSHQYLRDSIVQCSLNDGWYRLVDTTRHGNEPIPIFRFRQLPQQKIVKPSTTLFEHIVGGHIMFPLGTH